MEPFAPFFYYYYFFSCFSFFFFFVLFFFKYIDRSISVTCRVLQCYILVRVNAGGKHGRDVLFFVVRFVCSCVLDNVRLTARSTR